MADNYMDAHMGNAEEHLPLGELLGDVRYEDKSYEIRMPLVYQVETVDFNDDKFVFKVCAAAIGIPYNEFRYWPITKIFEISNKLGDAIIKLRGM